MNFEITSGKINSAIKVCIYGPEGIGKSTLAAYFPDPLFIDTEGSTKRLDVKRLPNPSSWNMLQEEIKYVIQTPGLCKTLIIDTLDWAEALCNTAVCAKYKKTGIEDFGYGKGYIYAKEEFGKFLNLLSDVIDKEINVVTTAHAKLAKFEQPEENGAYDMWTLKLGAKTGSQTSALVKEWADMLLFCNYKVVAVATDDNGKKFKAQGGSRVMYTTHHPCWDAKNRFGLPEEIPMDFKEIMHCIPGIETVAAAENTTPPKQQNIPPETTPVPPAKSEPTTAANPVPTAANEPKHLKGLHELMKHFEVTESEIQQAVASKGYYPVDTAIENYDPQFVDGVLVDAWNQVFEIIKSNRESTEHKGE